VLSIEFAREAAAMRRGAPGSNGERASKRPVFAESLRDARAILSKYVAPGRSLSQELIDERRREQRGEDQRAT
jgi:hypothetical protein